MKLRDLFRRRADVDVPEPPVPTPPRRPDWPAMRPVQRVVSSPDLITAPDRFTDTLLSWRNPSQGGILGHYVTPDAPGGVSDGLAAASPRGELPAPARPWWWPRPPAVQRRVPTSTLAPEPVPVGSDDSAPTPPPAVPVYPLTGHTLVSAAGVEPPPRLALPAVQRHADEPETSQAPGAGPDVPTGESPPEAPLSSVVAARTEPLSETSAGSAVSWPGSRLDLPAARRFGLGAPLQRVPDTGGGLSADSATVLYQTPVQRQAEVDAEPIEMAPLVSDSPPLASVAVSSIPSAAVDTADTSPHPDPGRVWSPSAEPTAATPTGAEPSPVQRRIETEAGVEPTDVAPLVSDTPPIASAGIPSTAIPSAEPAAGSRSTGPSPSPQSVQRAVDTLLQPSPSPMRSPLPEPTTVTPLPTAATPTGAAPSPVQRRIETDARVEPMDVAPLVSDTPPMASVVIPSAAGSGSAEPSPSARSPSRSTLPGLAVQRAADTPRQPGPHPVESPSSEPTAVTPLPTTPAPAGGGPSTAQRRIEVNGEPMEVAPLVSDSPPMASVGTPSTAPMAGSGFAGPSPSPGPSTRSTGPGLAVQRTADTPLQPEPRPVGSPSAEVTAATPSGAGPSTAQRRVQVEGEPMEVAPLVSDSPPMASVAIPSAGSGSAGPSRSAGSSTRSTEPSRPVQRAVDTPLQRESTDMPTPPIAAPAPLSDVDHTDARRTVTYDSVAPPVVGLVGDRPIEPVVTDYATAPVAEQTRWPAVQRHSTVEGQGRAAPVSGPGLLATTAVQRSAGAGVNPAAQWPPDALAVSRSSPGVSQQESPTQPVQFIQLAAAAPVAAESNPPELSTKLVVQQADDEPAAATGPVTATGAATGTTPAPPAGSTSPTEVDALARRLYDPIVRRLKVELQLDRERAGHSLDLRH